MKMTRSQAIELLRKGKLSTAMLKPLNIHFDHFLRFSQLDRNTQYGICIKLADYCEKIDKQK